MWWCPLDLVVPAATWTRLAAKTASPEEGKAATSSPLGSPIPTSPAQILAAALILLGACAQAEFDLAFDPLGYLYAAANVGCNVAYVFCSKLVAQSLGISGPDLTYLNTLMAVPSLVLLIVAGSDEPTRLHLLASDPAFTWLTRRTLALLVLHTLLGIAITSTSLLAVRSCSATTFSMTGAISKIPLTLISAWLFAIPWTTSSEAAIAIALVGAIIFTYDRSTARSKERHLIKSSAARL